MESAKEELKRADHSIYVSLKYTRTVDVIKNTIKRLLSAFDIAILQFLEYAKDKKKISAVPTNAFQRAVSVSQLVPHLKKNIDFYFMLKKVDRADYDKREEYRKNVTLIAKTLEKKIDVNIEALIKYFEYTVVFVDSIEHLIREDVFKKKRVKKTVKKKVKKK